MEEVMNLPATNPSLAFGTHECLELRFEREEILGHELFPLPLAPLEKYMLWDDTSDHPKRFRVAMRFHGTLDKHAAKLAFQWALPRHAMLLAEPDDSVKPTNWILPEVQTFRIPWGLKGYEQLPTEAFRGETKNFAGLRFWFHQEDQWIEWCLDFHHASTDGRGGRLFVLDLLRAYEEACQGHDHYEKPRRLDPKALLHRGVYRRLASSPRPSSEHAEHTVSGPESSKQEDVVRATTWQEKLVHGFHFHVLGPKPLAPAQHRTPSHGPPASPRLLYQKTSLTQDCTRQLEQRMLPNGLSWNELGLGLLFGTLGKWNEEQNRKHGRLRVMVPVDLRDYGDRYLPAANRFGFAFVVIQQTQSQDLSFVLRSVQEQMKRIQKLQLAVDFNGIFEACQHSRIGEWCLRRALSRLGCFATAVLTTLGDLTKHTRKSHRFEEDVPWVADMKLDAVVGVPPLRNQTSFSVGLTNAAGALHLASIVDQVALGAEAQVLHHRFCNAWSHWLQANSPWEDRE
jgi:hypothetical protein